MRVDYYHTFHPSMGAGHFGGLIFLLLIILVIFLLYKVYQYKNGSPCTTKSSIISTAQHNSSPLEILETRLVNGEIKVEEFLTMKKAMQTEFIPENKNQE